MQLKSSIAIIFFLVSLLAGFMLTTQFLFMQPVSNNNPVDSYQGLQDSIALLSTEQETLKSRLSLLQEELAKRQKNASDNTLQKELSDLKEQLALTEISGRGVKVILDDNFSGSTTFSPNESVCYAADLRDIVNVMKLAGAEGIAINDQRLNYATVLACVGESVIVNSVKMLPPFSIVAVTRDQSLLRNYLETDKYLVDLLNRKQAGDLRYTVESKSEIMLPAYQGSLNTDHLKAVSNDEL